MGDLKGGNKVMKPQSHTKIIGRHHGIIEVRTSKTWSELRTLAISKSHKNIQPAYLANTMGPDWRNILWVMGKPYVVTELTLHILMG